MIWFYIGCVFFISLFVIGSISHYKDGEKIDGFFLAFLAVLLIILMTVSTYYYGKQEAAKQINNNEYGWKIEKVYKDSVLIRTDSSYIPKKSIE